MKFKSLLDPEDPNGGDKKKDVAGPGRGRSKTASRTDPAAPAAKAESWALWFVVLLLSVTVIAGASWGYRRISDQRQMFRQLARVVAVEAVQAQVDAIDGRLSRLAERVATSEVVEGLASRISAVEHSLSVARETTETKFAAIEKIHDDMEWRVESIVEDRTLDMREQLAALESADQNGLERLAALEEEIDARLERLQAGLSLELAALQEDSRLAAEGFEGRLSGTERELELVRYEVARDRVDFETYRGFDEELMPGIYLHLSDVDRRYQRINGWIRLMPEGRFLRIKDHPIQQALVFYTHQDDRAHELVFTRVTETAAVGYLNIPSDDFPGVASDSWDAVAGIRRD